MMEVVKVIRVVELLVVWQGGCGASWVGLGGGAVL